MENQNIKLSSLNEKASNELLFSSIKNQNIEYFRVLDTNDGKASKSRQRKPPLNSEEMRKSHEYEVNKILNSNKFPQKIIFRMENRSKGLI